MESPKGRSTQLLAEAFVHTCYASEDEVRTNARRLSQAHTTRANKHRHINTNARTHTPTNTQINAHTRTPFYTL